MRDCVEELADLAPGPRLPRGVSTGEGRPTGVEGDSSPTSCSSKSRGFFDSFFSGLHISLALDAMSEGSSATQARHIRLDKRQSSAMLKQPSWRNEKCADAMCLLLCIAIIYCAGTPDWLVQDPGPVQIPGPNTYWVQCMFSPGSSQMCCVFAFLAHDAIK